MASPKMQNITARIPLEDYGWVVRYCEKNGLSQSYVVRKAIKMFIIATMKRKLAEPAQQDQKEAKQSSG